MKIKGRRSRQALRGVTLIETLVVLAILGGLAGMATLALRVPPGLALDRTVRAVSADLRQAHATALARGHVVVVSFDAEKRQVLVPDLGLSRDLPRSLRLTATGARDVDRAAGDETVDVRFYPDSSTSGADILLSTGSRTTRISVHWLTGQVQHGPG